MIYRPPPSKRKKSTVGLFLGEFQDFLQHHIFKSQKTLILGDFNFHYEVQVNTDASRSRDILSNHSLCQHVSGPTHMDGHTLDLIITKLTDNLVSKCTVSDFLTDHGSVHCDLYLPKPRLTIYCDLFKEQKRHVNQLISSAKSTYYTAKITEAASDHKQLLYNVVNALSIKPEASLPDGVQWNNWLTDSVHSSRTKSD